jgi:hypothetical protein
VFTSLTHHRKGPTRFISLNYGKCNEYIREIMADVLHDHVHIAPPCKVTFRHAFYHIHHKELFVSVEGFYSCQFFYCGNNEGGSNMLFGEREPTIRGWIKSEERLRERKDMNPSHCHCLDLEYGNLLAIRDLMDLHPSLCYVNQVKNDA